MARVISISMLWAVICLQLAFFIILSSLYVWKDKSLHTETRSQLLASCPLKCDSDRLHTPSGKSSVKESANHRSTKSKTISTHVRHRAKSPRRRPGTQLHTLDYAYSLNPADKVCAEPVYLLVIVESTTYNAMEREYFRSRWKVEEYNNKKIATVFVTADSDINGTQNLLALEYHKYADILHIDFDDSYRNLTLKTMLSLRWAVDECQPFKYVMKTDDDMIINFDVLITLLENLPSNITTDLYTGVMMSHKPPIRDMSDKWHVTFEEYPHGRYPDYMGGPGYVLSYQAANKIIAASYKVPFMPMEDVFVGICAKEAGITGYSSLRFSNWEIWDYYNYCWAREMTILHKADMDIRELYYYDRFINTHSFNFNSWGRQDIIKNTLFSQKRANRQNDSPEFLGYPMVYKCSPLTWQMEKAKCLHKHINKWKIPLHKIIDV